MRGIVAFRSRTGTFTLLPFTGPKLRVIYYMGVVDTTTEGVVPDPVQGKSVGAAKVSGTVKVRVAGSKRFVTLAAGKAVPVGSEIDTRSGTVALSSAKNSRGTAQEAQFRGGRFVVRQRRGAALTTLGLSGTELRGCPRGRRASAAARRVKKRRLFGSGKGQFTTRGKYGSATIRGTRWRVEDFCDRTRITSLEGTVTVRDLVKRRTVTLTTGRSYTARAA